MQTRARLFLLFVALVGCQRAEGAKAPPAWAASATPADHTYGVYLNGAKVGWMRSTVAVSDVVELAIELRARVGGMGQVSAIELREHRTYAGPDGKLVALSFEQRAATGSVEVRGKRQGKDIVLEVSAGAATHEERHEVAETLRDALAAQVLAREGKPGATAESVHFDPSLQKSIVVEHRLAATDERMLAGIPTRTARIESTYRGLGVSETSWLDDTGKTLETKVGGFFTARLEPPDVARKLDYSQDLLAAAVVKTPRVIENPERLERFGVSFRGFGDLVPPASERQQVERRGDEVAISLSREPTLPRVPAGAVKVPPEVAPELAPTAFIQSEAPAVRAAARKAIGDAKLLPEVVEALTGYVYEHVQDEYVPAYSNALEALTTGRGDCTEHSVLFVALARSLGIPARVAVGIAYWPPGGGFGWHAWAEVWVSGRWYAVDPTWNQPLADATHIKLAGGGPAEQARIVMLLGRLQVTRMET